MVNQFKGKKVTILGLGLLGKGIGDARFFAESGADVLVTDLKTEVQLATALEELKDYKNITYVLGEHRLEDFRHCDLVIKGGGAPLDSIYIAEARKHNIPVEMDASLFAKYTDAQIIGVTGTRGKSTTTQALYEILKKYYKKGKVFLGGNVRGLATLPLLAEAKHGDVVVMELDSWQLQGFGEGKISPHIAVFTNFLSDHLNYYTKVATSEYEAMNLYFHDKAQIFTHQKKEDYLIAHSQVIERIKKYAPILHQQVVIANKDTLPAGVDLKILGEHNRENMALVFEALCAFGLHEKDIITGLEKFNGIEGRLELVRELPHDIKVYNDTTATTPIALIMALRALGSETKKRVVLIMGGADKALDMTDIYPELNKYAKTVVLLPGTGTDRVRERVQDIVGSADVFDVVSLAEGVSVACAHVQSGDVLVLSPGFASFGLFKNEYDRGDRFDAIIKNL